MTHYVNHKNISAEQLRLTDQPVEPETRKPEIPVVPPATTPVKPEKAPEPEMSTADARKKAIDEALRISREKHDAGRLPCPPALRFRTASYRADRPRRRWTTT